ncbi:MAG: hypothetical protein IMZ69_05570 [Spirochaetes bacterium]|nr:hypothetical protein [Spirochaetota bacterium]
MRKRIVILAAILLASAAFGSDTRLSVSDLAVHSGNPQYTYVGKGLAEMIAVELRKSPDITLIEREKRRSLLEEMEFSLSDLADSGRQAEVGRMLAAGYMVFGELIDMGPQVLITLRMVDVQTSEVVWSQMLTDTLSRYDYIAGYFASSIMQHFGAQVSRTTEVKMADRSEKKAETVVALSTAIDLYDRKEKDLARKELAVAQKLDPKSEAAAWLLGKLVTNTTRFKVLMEQYYSYLNPAFLGIMREDMFHFAANTDVFPIITHIPIENVNYASFGGDKAISEMDFNVRFGYAFPMGRNWGIRIDALPTVGSLNRGWVGHYGSQLETARTAAGAVLDIGLRVGERVAIGAGVGIYSRSASDVGPQAAYLYPDKAVVAGDIGFLYRKPDESLIFDSRVGYTNETYETFDQTLNLVGEVAAPVFWENTLTMAFQEKATFLILKQINNVSLDRPYTFVTLMPAVEHFFAPWVSVRAGLEGSMSLLNETFQMGFGALTGITFRSLRRGFDVDLNLTWRQRPSRVVEGVLYTDLMALINLTWNGIGMRRE